MSESRKKDLTHESPGSFIVEKIAQMAEESRGLKDQRNVLRAKLEKRRQEEGVDLTDDYEIAVLEVKISGLTVRILEKEDQIKKLKQKLH